MQTKTATFHYHIHWAGQRSVDWQRFLTAPEAGKRAEEIARPRETYVIEKFDEDDCAFCLSLRQH